MTSPSEETRIFLRVQRGDLQSGPSVDEFVLPPDAADSLLDALRWVRVHVDDTLAFRYACINANACKECMMQLDGKTVYACIAKLTPGQRYDVAPFPNKPLVRDLVTEIAPPRNGCRSKHRRCLSRHKAARF